MKRRWAAAITLNSAWISFILLGIGQLSDAATTSTYSSLARNQPVTIGFADENPPMLAAIRSSRVGKSEVETAFHTFLSDQPGATVRYIQQAHPWLICGYTSVKGSLESGKDERPFLTYRGENGILVFKIFNKPLLADVQNAASPADALYVQNQLLKDCHF